MEATALSTNTAFVALAEQLGGCKVRDTMLRLGLHQADGQPVGQYAPQYILGASDVSPQGVAHAYGVLAADGKKCPMVAVTKITQGGKNIALPATTCTQVVDPDVVSATDKFLEYNMTNGSGIRNQLDDGNAPVGRQDRYGQQQQRVVVRRLHAAARDGRLGRHALRPDLARHEERHRRRQLLPRHARCRHRRPDLEGHHEQGPRRPADRQRSGALGQARGRATRLTSPASPACRSREADLDPPGRRLPAGVGGTMSSSVPSGLVAGTSPYGEAASGSFVTIYTSRGVRPAAAPQTHPHPTGRHHRPPPRRVAAASTANPASPGQTDPAPRRGDAVTTKARRDPRRAFVVRPSVRDGARGRSAGEDAAHLRRHAPTVGAPGDAALDRLHHEPHLRPRRAGLGDRRADERRQLVVVQLCGR